MHDAGGSVDLSANDRAHDQLAERVLCFRLAQTQELAHAFDGDPCVVHRHDPDVLKNKITIDIHDLGEFYPTVK